TTCPGGRRGRPAIPQPVSQPSAQQENQSMSQPAEKSPQPDIVLAVNNIEVVYDEVILVLRGVSLAVPQGQIVTLLGANGAGKSTTLKAISGLLKSEDGAITRGQIEFDGATIINRPAEAIVRQGIFQVMEGRRVIED